MLLLVGHLLGIIDKVLSETVISSPWLFCSLQEGAGVVKWCPIGQRQFDLENAGEVTEWLKVHAWNACVRQRTVGSNPTFSARYFTV